MSIEESYPFNFRKKNRTNSGKNNTLEAKVDSLGDRVEDLKEIQNRVLIAIGIILSIAALIFGFQLFKLEKLHKGAQDALETAKDYAILIETDQKITDRVHDVHNILNTIFLLNSTSSTPDEKNDFIEQESLRAVNTIDKIRSDLFKKKKVVRQLNKNPDVPFHFKERLNESLNHNKRILESQATIAFFSYLKTKLMMKDWRDVVDQGIDLKIGSSKKHSFNIDEKQLYTAPQIYRMMALCYHLCAAENKVKGLESEKYFKIAESYYTKAITLIEKGFEGESAIYATKLEYPNKNADLINLAEIHALEENYKQAYFDIRKTLECEKSKKLELDINSWGNLKQTSGSIKYPENKKIDDDIEKGVYDQFIMRKGSALIYCYIDRVLNQSHHSGCTKTDIFNFGIILSKVKKIRGSVPGFFPDPLLEIRNKIENKILPEQHKEFYEFLDLFISFGNY